MSTLVVAAAWLLIWAQAGIEAYFSADTGSPLVGQPVTLTLTATFPPGAAVSGWPEFPQEWPPFEVREAGEVRISETSEGGAVYQQNLTVILWNVGEFETPETVIQYELIGDSQTRALSVEPAFFSVPSVLDPNDTALRPLKPQEVMPYTSPLLVAAAAGGALAVAAIAAHTLLARRSAKPLPETGPTTPAKIAMAELRRIAGRNLSPALVYQAVSDTLRVYVQSEFRVQALDMTTWELMTTMRARVPETTQTELQRMLEQADLVKFARYQPDAATAQRYLETAARWLKSLDKDTAP